MRVVVLEDYLNYAATLACIEPLKRLGEVVCYTKPAKSEAQNLERMAGAGFDVYAKEPLPKDHPLRSLPNVVMQPHMGGYTEEGYGWKFIPAVNNIVAFIEGRPQRLAGEKDIARQKQCQAAYLT